MDIKPVGELPSSPKLAPKEKLKADALELAQLILDVFTEEVSGVE